MTEQTPDEIAALISEAENTAQSLLAIRMSKLEELASDLRGLVLTLSDREQFDPAIWQQGCDEIEKGVSELKRDRRDIQKISGPGFLHRLEKLRAYPAAQSAIWNYKGKLETLPSEVMMFYREYKAFKARFFEDRVIFLDIDGVLLTFGNWVIPHNYELVSTPVEARMDQLQLDPRSIALIVKLCDLADASLVLASGWRKTWPHDHEALLDRLVEQGLRRELWHQNWMLPVLPGFNKWQELAKWTEGASNLVALIIDDEVPANPQPLHAKKVEILQTSTREGFGFYNYVDALKFFEVDDKAVKVPPSLPPRGTQFYPTMGGGGPSRRTATSIRP